MRNLALLDHQIFNYFNHLAGQNHFLDKILLILALYLIYLVPLILIILWFWSGEAKKIALKATAAGLLAWLGFSNLIGSFYYRARPFVSQTEIKELLFHRPDRSFPSDHAAFLFALAFTFWFLKYRKLSILIFFLAVLISVTRIIVGVHYPADIVAGFLLGLVSAVLIWFLDKPLDKIFEPLISFFKKLRLA